MKTFLNLALYALLCAGVFLMGFFVVAPSLKKNTVRQDLRVAVPDSPAPSDPASVNTDKNPAVEVIRKKADAKPETDKPKEKDQEDMINLEIHQTVSKEASEQKDQTTQQPSSTADVEVRQKEEPVQVQPSMGLYRVEVASFSDESSAAKAAESLASKGYEPVTNKVITESGTQYRLQVGAYRNKDNADRIADDVRKAGYSAEVIGSDR
jgi:cell division protein FtsN